MVACRHERDNTEPTSLMAPHTQQETSHRVDFLDPMRGFAIFAVFAFHCLRAANDYNSLNALMTCYVVADIAQRLAEIGSEKSSTMACV